LSSQTRWSARKEVVNTYFLLGLSHFAPEVLPLKYK
jgi:hypothetical protein